MNDYADFIKSSPLALAVFYAPWCPHCKRMHTTVADAVELLDGRVAVRRMNIDEYAAEAATEHVASVPTFIAYREGKAVWRHAGVMSGDMLLGKMEELLNDCAL